jgi:hypothetical protein
MLCFIYILKCSIPSCVSGPDNLCSDGFCYTGSQCPNGTTIVNNATCTCGISCGKLCSDTCASGLQVKFNFSYAFWMINFQIILIFSKQF